MSRPICWCLDLVRIGFHCEPPVGLAYGLFLSGFGDVCFPVPPLDTLWT